MNLVTIGHWSLIGGIVLAIIAGAGLTQISGLAAILFILGLIVGFLNVTETESTPFLVAVIALIVIGVAGLQFGQLSPAVTAILENFIAFVGAAGLVVSIKQILSAARPTS